MRRPTPVDDRQEFTVDRSCLIRTVRTTKGGTYEHRCPADAYKDICWFIESHASEGVTIERLWDSLPDVSWTQAAVAVAFLKERGCLVVELRRCLPSSGVFFEDAMVEFYAAAERGT